MRNWPFADIEPYSCHLISIDPAWPWVTHSSKGARKSPSAHYKTMTLEEIAALPVLEVARSPCLLLCWGTVPLMGKQIEIIKHWGFKYQSAIFWHKVSKNGKNMYGTGHRVRSMVEPVFLATLGSPQHKAFPGMFPGVRREHSRKPEEFYHLVDKCCPALTPRADIYARVRRKGYMSFGDELDKFSEESA